MKKTFLLLLISACAFGLFAQDSQIDYSAVNPKSAALEHLLPLFTIHGVPKNQYKEDNLTLLINHGYCMGFSTLYNQPRWVAYQVSKSTRDTDYDRFPFFADDYRLDKANRIGSETFGNGYDLGHLAPNEAINRQYGKLAQMETFLVSNLSPQKSGLNQGVWAKLEAEILNKYPMALEGKNKKAHLWVIVGPVFPEKPEYIIRPNGTKVAVPEAFFCILARPRRYPFDTPGNAEYLAFLFPQDTERNEKIDLKFVTTINEIEKKTGINFFPELTKTMEGRIENAAGTELW